MERRRGRAEIRLEMGSKAGPISSIVVFHRLLRGVPPSVLLTRGTLSRATSAGPAQNPQCKADDIEAKWAKAGYPGRIP
jgi:hypothetical protein